MVQEVNTITVITDKHKYEHLGIPFAAMIIDHCIETKIPFTVIFTPNPSEKEQHNGK